ncbi:porin [Paraburkholderia sp. BL10I2N1]|uniref:porin n=1 Tax=Paraburkholderia sp. BL10I2N1 TaxID=1938796 RepID=UPI00105DA71C|nr:porin [Paraburkholderia sp. BL10I2N1]TDN70005.1 putative porin [Paraburkholderia sp. BL10I2N1]
MKVGEKWLIAVCVGGCVGVAHAQSSVTLYGVFDQGVLAVTNVHGAHVYQSSGGWLSGSRWGLRGAEDLGGGAQAIFVLENGFDGSTGAALQGARQFGRQAYVGLSNSYGKLTFGRQYDMVVDHLAVTGMTAEIWGGAFACSPGDVDNLCNSRRMDNSVKYSSPSFGGFSFGSAYSFGGVPGELSRSSIWTAGADYSNGSLTGGVGYFNVNSPNTASYGGAAVSGTANTFTNGMSSSPVISGFASANRQETLAAGVNYTIGSSTFGASYTYTRFDGLGTFAVAGTPVLNGTAKVQNAEARYFIYVTPFLVTGIAFHYTAVGAAGSIAGARYRQLDLGVNYYLSKRTTLYAVLAMQSANGQDSTGKPAVAALAFVSPSSSNHQAAAQIGIRHRF